jgi:O-antigen/teichoic acid export membrane protein
MMKYSAPLIPASLAFWVLNASSSYVLNQFVPLSEIGLYQIGNSIAAGVNLFVAAFQTAWGPFAFSILDKKEARQTYATVLTVYVMLMCFIALGVALFSKELLMLLTNPRYYGSAVVAGILAFNATLSGYTYIASIGSSVVKKTAPVATAIIIAALITAVLYFTLIPWLGKEGAAISTTLGYLFVPVYVFYRSQKLWPVPYKFKLVGSVFLLSVGAFLISLALPDFELLQGIVVKLLLLLTYFVLCGVTFYSSYPTQFTTALGRLRIIKVSKPQVLEK